MTVEATAPSLLSPHKLRTFPTNSQSVITYPLKVTLDKPEGHDSSPNTEHQDVTHNCLNLLRFVSRKVSSFSVKSLLNRQEITLPSSFTDPLYHLRQLSRRNCRIYCAISFFPYNKAMESGSTVRALRSGISARACSKRCIFANSRFLGQSVQLCS